MSKKQKKSKSRIERIRELPEAAREVLEEKVVKLEEEVREQRNTLIIGAGVFLLGVAVGIAVTKRRGD